ncbi:hypothetical protein CDD83_7920 [Cordyceps sp. RAO-2017]|nr:hypothetical protein CDD83_7920 [Cordyceps sp. RAO-2017]
MDMPERDLDRISKGWDLAMFYSQERLKRIYSLEGEQLKQAVNEGRLILETVCLFIHACIKRGQYKLPPDFWRFLQAEYGILVYPSAMTEEIDVQGLGVDVTFTEAYCEHIVMYGRCPESCYPPPCPMKFILEPPPQYCK